MALINTLRVSCQKATMLMERREFRALGAGEQVGLWYHLRICNACRAFERQSALIDRLLNDRKAKAEDTTSLEERILRELQR